MKICQVIFALSLLPSTRSERGGNTQQRLPWAWLFKTKAFPGALDCFPLLPSKLQGQLDSLLPSLLWGHLPCWLLADFTGPGAAFLSCYTRAWRAVMGGKSYSLSATYHLHHCCHEVRKTGRGMVFCTSEIQP